MRASCCVSVSRGPEMGRFFEKERSAGLSSRVFVGGKVRGLVVCADRCRAGEPRRGGLPTPRPWPSARGVAACLCGWGGILWSGCCGLFVVWAGFCCVLGGMEMEGRRVGRVSNVTAQRSCGVATLVCGGHTSPVSGALCGGWTGGRRGRWSSRFFLFARPRPFSQTRVLLRNGQKRRHPARRNRAGSACERKARMVRAPA